jgi:hypothetical protein
MGSALKAMLKAHIRERPLIREGRSMPIEQLEITEADLKYARLLLRSWAFERAGSSEENAVRAVAEGIAYGRRQGLELAKAKSDA